MTFEGKGLRVIIPLDPSQGERRTEPLTHEDQDVLDQIYNITAKEDDYEDPPTEGWESGSSCMSDFEDGLESWQNRLYELQGHRCAKITKSLRRLSSQTRALPICEGSTDLEVLIVLNSLKLVTLESTFGATIAKGWNSRKKYIPSWEACQKFLYMRFGG